MELFQYTLASGETRRGDTVPEGEIIELIFYRNEERFAEDGIRKQESHPLHEAMATRLPGRLRILRAVGCKLRTWPALPTTIHECYLSGNWFLALPDLSALTNLIVLDLSDNNIPEVVHGLPANLVHFNLTCNAIRRFTALVPTGCTVKTDSNPYNPFPTIVTAGAAAAAAGAGAAAPKNLFADAQNVHDSAVQGSTNRNIAYLAKYKPEVPMKRLLLDSIERAFLDNRRNPAHILKEFAKNPYSMHGVSFMQLVDRVWLRILDIADSEIRREAMKRFSEEVAEGEHLCTNGMMVRLANSLVGFDDAITIELKPEQILSNRIPATQKRLLRTMGSENLAYWLACYSETLKDLRDVGLPEKEWEAWLWPLTEPILEEIVPKIPRTVLEISEGPEVQTISEKIASALRGHELQGYSWEVAYVFHHRELLRSEQITAVEEIRVDLPAEEEPEPQRHFVRTSNRFLQFFENLFNSKSYERLEQKKND